MYAALYAPGNLPSLLDCAKRFSPHIEITSEDVVTVDVRGGERLFGAPPQLAQEIERTIGVHAQIALASNPDTAIYTSRGYKALTIVHPGEEASCLAPLSLHLLGCPPALGELLDLWGLRTFGQFGRLPSQGIAERCGQQGIYWQRQALGLVQRQLRVIGEPIRFLKETSWDEPISILESLLFALGKLLFELCIELVARSLATVEVQVCLKLGDNSEHFVALRLPVPVADSKTLLTLLQIELEQRPTSKPVQSAQVELKPATPKATQEHLFTATYPFPDQLELTLARVRRIVGANSVGTPFVLDTHDPEGFVMKPFAPSACIEKPPTDELPRLAFRRFRPPQAAKVVCQQQQPLSIYSVRAKGPISFCHGPWYSSGHWWQTDAWQREEWDVGLPDGSLFKIYRDLTANSWFIEGNYD